MKHLTDIDLCQEFIGSAMYERFISGLSFWFIRNLYE